eukprot:TRINITY_DN2118_c0_g1_i1.p1 TRINITY_DN2118_c0_g1~~TRINITY_DN2118_c0_g1_i1.p1  ORF type:complete len:111 (-),score=24.51 TRINITY_DN2118_c0_g1_i1:503-835(-)
MEFEPSKEIVPEEVDTVIRESIEQALGQTAFIHNKLNVWTSNIVESCLKRLSSLSKPYKYVVTCNIMQKTGAGLHCACTSYWDPDTDGKQTVVWENPTMHVIVTVFWLGF